MSGTFSSSSTWHYREPVRLAINNYPANLEGKSVLNHQSLIERLKTVPHFKGVPDPILKDIVFAGQVLSFPAESILYREEETAAGLFVLFRGQVNLCKIGLRGQVSMISIIKPVIMFNEVTVIDGGPNPVTAIAAKDCTTWQVSYDRFQTLMNRYPIVGTGLLRMLAQRNRAMLRLYEDLVNRPVLARVAKLLLDLSQNGQQPINRTHHSNHLIASLVATVPEAVSRSIKILKTHEFIDCNRTEIKILQPAKLVKCAMIEPMILETIQSL
jgi:CRP/FNR family transcriptional regulator